MRVLWKRGAACGAGLVLGAAVLAGCFVDRSGAGHGDEQGPSDGGPTRDAAPMADAGRPDGCTPAEETCDGRDEDCDGRVDEAVTERCATECGEATRRCVDGVWGECSAPEPVDEVCNALDDDCDLRIDEALTRACSTACGEGTERCSAGAWIECDAPPVLEETCDGTDEDCDLMTDEGLSRTCSTVCGTGTEICVDAAWSCDAPVPSDEICNATGDEDCDGSIDEGGVCGCDQREYGGHTYQLCGGEEVSWTAARDACRSLGYELVTVDDAAEDEWLVAEISALHDADWWIGLNDRGDGREGMFRWVSGSASSYRNWSTRFGGQPDNFANEDCVAIENGHDWRWNDRDCGDERRFVCESP
jgi:hypothetical protein